MVLTLADIDPDEYVDRFILFDCHHTLRFSCQLA